MEKQWHVLVPTYRNVKKIFDGLKFQSHIGVAVTFLFNSRYMSLLGNSRVNLDESLTSKQTLKWNLFSSQTQRVRDAEWVAVKLLKLYNFPPQPLYFWFYNFLLATYALLTKFKVFYNWYCYQFLILKNLFSSPIELVRFVEETRLLFSMACPQLRPHHPQTKIKERRKFPWRN